MLDRRGFVSALAALSAGAALGKKSVADVSPSDAWLDRLKGKHRQLFDAPDPDGGTVLRHVRNYLDVWRDTYGVRERDVSVIVVLYARTTPLGLQDAMWAKYKLGAALSLTDSTTSAPLEFVLCPHGILKTERSRARVQYHN